MSSSPRQASAFSVRSIASRLVLAVTLICAAACAILGLIAIRTQDGLTDLALRREMDLQYRSVIAAFDYEGRAASAVAVTIANLPALPDALTREDRTVLSAMLDKPASAAKDLGMGTWSFTRPPGVTVYRTHNPTSFGDDVSSRRGTVAKLYRDAQLVTGVETGVAGIGKLFIYGTAPVTHDGKLVGAVDIGIQFAEQFVQRVKDRFSVDVAVHQLGDGKVVTLGATFAGNTLATEAELRSALGGTPVMRLARLESKPVELYLGQLKNFAGTPIAVIELVKDVEGFHQAQTQSRWLLILATLVVLAAAIVFALVVGRGMSRPVVQLRDTMAALSAGRTDAVIPGQERHDELGAMAQAVAVFKDNMIEAERLRRQNESDRLAAEAQRRRLLLEMADNFEVSVQAVVQAVSDGAEQMTDTARSMTGTAEMTQTQTQSVAAASEQASANVQAVASATEELSSSIDEIARQTGVTTQVASAVAEDGRKAETIMAGLTEQTRRIGEIVQLIQGIASQTNLLALNATIEAARAGEAGKGFAVVAGEVKQLANQTARATEDIQAQVGGIQSETEVAADAIRAIAARVEELRSITASVAGAVEEQGAATQEIARNVQQASSGTQEISRILVSVSGSAQRTGEAAGQVLLTAQSVASESTRLRGETDRFIAKIRAD